MRTRTVSVLEEETMNEPAAIAIDGPVASGKSTVGRKLAQRLGYRFVDTGVMYRAVTWIALRERIAIEDEEALAMVASNARIQVNNDPWVSHETVVDGVEITAELNSNEVERAVSSVSKIRGVRQALVIAQQQMAATVKMVMAGRDIGTVVLPDAPFKVFLIATAAERIRRRFEEMQRGGRPLSENDVRRDLTNRDVLDSGRTESPLRAAPDAHRVVTDGLTIEAVVDRIIEIIKGR